MAKLLARDPERACIPSGFISSPDLGLHGGAEHNPHDAADDMDNPVAAGWGDGYSVNNGGCLREVVECTNAAAGVGRGEVGGVTLGGEDHVGRAVGDGCVGMR